MTISEISLA